MKKNTLEVKNTAEDLKITFGFLNTCTTKSWKSWEPFINDIPGKVTMSYFFPRSELSNVKDNLKIELTGTLLRIFASTKTTQRKIDMKKPINFAKRFKKIKTNVPQLKYYDDLILL